VVDGYTSPSEKVREVQMIGMVQMVRDTRPHCTNGWKGTARSPACNYTGGHYCNKLLGHKGKCKCWCGATTSLKPDRKGD
jgi:hypothetical protein